MSKLPQLAQAIRVQFDCGCTDADGNGIDPTDCPCGGDGEGPGHSEHGCWCCQAQAAIDEATGMSRTPGSGGTVKP